MAASEIAAQPEPSSRKPLLPLHTVVAPAPQVAWQDIRPICPQDVAAVAAALPPAPYRTHADDLDWQRTGAVTELVAWQGSTPVGCGFIHWGGPRDAAIAALLPDCPEIFRLHVLEAHRSKGIGAALIWKLEALARASGRARIGLGVGIGNRRAQLLYERLGYCPADAPPYIDRWQEPGPDGRPVTFEDPCVYMTKVLGAATPGHASQSLPVA